ncbi:MAG TPA: hypothetical protein VGC37_00735, partial [Friedmanniella sp.]
MTGTTKTGPKRSVAVLAVALALAVSSVGTAAVAAPVAPKGVLDPIQSNSSGTQATATAHFTPADKGQKVKLQKLTIVTTNTDEVKTAKWKTIETDKENADGDVTFDIDNPLEVSHSYRAITDDDAATTSNEVTFAASTTTKNTGLSTVYLNTNEGHSINTRKHFFEGQFTMTASTAVPECTAVPTQSHAEAKGRGN